MKSKGLKPFYSNRNAGKKLKTGETLYIDEIFGSIQTEGPFSGNPAIFVRLFGCSLNCGFCDTPQEDEAKKMKVKEIVMRVESIADDYDNGANTNLVVITGGEPFLYNMGPLVGELLAKKFWVQFETSGSVAPKGLTLPMEGVRIITSPKTAKIDKQIEKNTLAFKYVVDVKHCSKKDGLPEGVYRPKEKDSGRVMVSPKFVEKSKQKTEDNIANAVKVCKRYGYWFTLQYHKLINIE
jgi:organic radical activating enzyme